MNTYNNLVTVEDFNNYYEEDYSLITKFKEFPNQYKKNHGICCQYDKPIDGESPIQFYLPTQYVTGEVGYYYKDWNDGKNHRTPQKKCKYQKQEFFFSNYLEALDAVNNYRQILAGLTHNRRDVIILDIDETFDEGHLEMIDNISNIYGIPHYNYVLINDRTQHYQIGWFLDRPFHKDKTTNKFSEEYNELRNALNRLFLGDVNFKNGLIKNPCCQRDMTTYWYDLNTESLVIGSDALIAPVNRDDLRHSVLLAFEDTYGMTLNEYLLMEKEEHVEKAKELNLSEEATKRLLNYTESFASRETSDINSRHTYSFEYATKDCFRYMNEHKGTAPSMEWVINRIIDLQKEAITFLNDPARRDVEDYSKITSTARFILDFCINHWSPEHITGWKNNNYGNELHKMASLVTAFKYKKLREDRKNKDVCKELGITENSGTKYNKMDITEIEKSLTEFYNKHRNDCGSKTKELCEEINSLININEPTYSDTFEEYAAIYSNPYLDRGVLYIYDRQYQ